jgi:hypothetical protein
LLIATIVRASLILADGSPEIRRRVELRRDDLAGLPYLELVGDESRIDGGPRRTERRAEHVGELGDEPEALGAAERAPAGDDAPRRHQLRPCAAAGPPRHEARVTRQRDVEGALRDGRRRPFGHSCVRREAYRRDDDALGIRVDGHDGIAGVNGPAEAVRAQDGEHVADLPDAEQRRGDARQQILAERRRRAEQVAEPYGQACELRRENGR